jgi:hypothetical protein
MGECGILSLVRLKVGSNKSSDLVSLCFMRDVGFGTRNLL